MPTEGDNAPEAKLGDPRASNDGSQVCWILKTMHMTLLVPRNCSYNTA